MGDESERVESTADAGKWQWQQLSIAASCRYGQDGVLWSIIGFFWGTNALLLVALFSGGKIPESLAVKVIPCSVGIVMSGVWLVMQEAALRRIKWYERLMKRMEDELLLEEHCRLTPEEKSGRPGLSRNLPQARSVMWWVPILTAAAWFVGMVLMILPHLCGCGTSAINR